MIRIDEIYNNIFLQVAQAKDKVGVKWFDPFGTTNFQNLVSLPNGIHAEHYLFYDQEVIYKEHFAPFAEQYLECYKGRNVLVHSEYNSETVEWACNTYGFESLYYFFHGWAALDWYRGYNRSFLHQKKNIKHSFLCPNNIVGGKRRHRIDLFNELCKRNLVDSNLISMPEYCPYERISVQQYLDHDAKLPLTIDDFDNYANNSHQITMWEQASESLVQVVTETCYTGRKNHLTEKIFKPIVLKQPFIIVGNQGSLQYLKRYGFKTFQGIWDESYDNLPDDQRISAIADLLLDLEQSDLQDLDKQCQRIVQHNYDWFYSGKFEQVLWDELLAMIEKW